MCQKKWTWTRSVCNARKENVSEIESVCMCVCVCVCVLKASFEVRFTVSLLLVSISLITEMADGG